MQVILKKIAREIDRTVKIITAFLVSRIPFRQVKRLRDEQCWLIGGSVGKAYADNGAALHKYITEHYPDINVYWVINKNSSDVEKARLVGPTLYREDLKTYIYGLLAQVQIVSHGLHDVPTCSSKLSKRAVKVRLGHGLTALKKTNGSLLRSVETKSQIFDLVPVSSEFEAEIKRNWGFTSDQIAVTGLPRFDELLRKRELSLISPGEVQNSKILYMPTWRDWLPPESNALVGSDFYAQVVAFLMDPGLNECLMRHNIFIDVHLHIIMQQNLNTMMNGLTGLSNVRVLPSGVDLQVELVSSKLLITDYSSVAWDFLYLDKPVLFYQFDLEKFTRYRGAYIDLNDLFGPVAYNPRQAVALTRTFIEQDFDCTGYKEMMDRWQKKAFPYRDANNCARTVEAILKLLDD